jgi:hypothetical protein
MTEGTIEIHTLLESPHDTLHLRKILDGVAGQRDKTGLVPFVESPDPTVGKIAAGVSSHHILSSVRLSKR